MIGEFEELNQFTEEEAIETVLEDHPDLRLLWERRPILKSPIEINGINPVLHILLESIVEHQIIKNDPPEARSAFERLMKNGMTRHAARMTIASLFVPYMFETLKERKPFNTEDYSRQLALLGTKLKRVGRNDPCPCGSGKKFKHCCIDKFRNLKPLQSNVNPEKKVDEKLVLGSGHYATLDYLKATSAGDPVLLLENRVHISAFLEENGDLDGARMALKENIALAESLGKEGLIKNAYSDMLFLCQNHKELAGEGLEVIDKLLSLSRDEDEIGCLRCDRADLLARQGKVDEAEREFESIFKDMPEWYFGRYRYALFLENLGRKPEALEVLKELESIKDKLDEFTYSAVTEVLEDMTG